MSNQYMKRAIELSKNNIAHGGGPFGAVIVKDGKIIGEGFNKVTANNDPTAHAEVEAIREACKNISNFDLNGAEIYTSCEPCPMCLSAIYWARLSKVYFANTKKDAAAIEFDDDFIYTEIPKPIEQRKISMVQMMRPEALEVFKAWQTSTVKIKY
ncbi:MAG: nucleoside deaminase [Bdellovibrionota bacterium]